MMGKGVTRFIDPVVAAFALPSIPMAIMNYPIATIVPVIYAKQFSIPLIQIGFVFFLCRILDAVCDPIIGYLSDLTRSRLGARKPWIIGGAAVSCMAAFLLYLPPVTPGIAYYASAMFFLFLAWTVLEIPYAAWAAEITRDYNRRSLIQGYRSAFQMLGSIIFALIPYAAASGVPHFDLHFLNAVGWVTLILLPLSVAVAMIFTPHTGVPTDRAMENPLQALAVVVANKPLQNFLATFILSGTASGMQAALGYLYMDKYLGIASWYSIILLLSLFANLFSIPLWIELVRRFGRERAWAIGTIATSICTVAIIMIQPSAHAAIQFVAVYTVMSIAMGCLLVCPGAMMGDIIDYETLRSGKMKAGSVSSLVTLVVKFNSGIGAGLALTIVGFFGLELSRPQPLTASAILGLKLGVGAIPILLQLISACLIWWFPLTQARQLTIRRWLERSAGLNSFEVVP